MIEHCSTIAVTSVGNHGDITIRALQLLDPYANEYDVPDNGVLWFDIGSHAEGDDEVTDDKYQIIVAPTLENVIDRIKASPANSICALVVNNIHNLDKSIPYKLVVNKLDEIYRRLRKSSAKQQKPCLLIVTGYEITNNQSNNATTAAILYCGMRITIDPGHPRQFYAD